MHSYLQSLATRQVSESTITYNILTCILSLAKCHTYNTFTFTVPYMLSLSPYSTLLYYIERGRVTCYWFLSGTKIT